MIAEMTQSQLLDTFVSNDPATNDLLMQLFFSDLAPEEEVNKLGVETPTTPPSSLDIDRKTSVASTASTPTSSLATVPQLPSPEPLVQANSDAGSEAPSPFLVSDSQTHICDDVFSALINTASPLECTNSSDFNDPLDNPFLTESTDLSNFMQDTDISILLTSSTSTTSSSTAPPSSSIVSELCLSPSIIGSNTSEHVNVTNTHTQNDLNIFDLSQANSIVTAFDTAEMEDLEIDFSAFCDDTLSVVPSSPDELTTLQLSVMLTQAQQSTSPSTEAEIVVDQSSVSNTDDNVFVESSPQPTSEQLSVQDQSPVSTGSRKRTVSDLESDTDNSPPDAKKTKPTRRQKNNVASQISRAKRRAKNVAAFDRVGKLEAENAKLRLQEKELTVEIEKLKKLLVNRLSQ